MNEVLCLVTKEKDGNLGIMLSEVSNVNALVAAVIVAAVKNGGCIKKMLSYVKCVSVSDPEKVPEPLVIA